MQNGNYIEATLKNGVLEVTVLAAGKGKAALRRDGWKLLDDVFRHFGEPNITAFDAEWIDNPKFADNYREFVANLTNGTPEEQAAWKTWTGRQLKGRGWRGQPVVRPVSNGYRVLFTP